MSGLDRIRRAEPADSLAIAGLHGREIPWGLLSQLGVAFVATFYQALLASPQGFAFVAERDGRIVGFASGVLTEFAARHVLAVRVTAGGENTPANRLYERMGFRLHSFMEIHPGEQAAVYVIALPPGAVRHAVPS